MAQTLSVEHASVCIWINPLLTYQKNPKTSHNTGTSFDPLLPPVASLVFSSLLQSSLKELYIITVSNFFLSFFLSPRTPGFCSQTTPKVVARGSHRATCNQFLVLSLLTCGQHPTLWIISLPWSSKPNAHVAFLPSLWLIPLRILCWFLLVSQPLWRGTPELSPWWSNFHICLTQLP